MIDVRKPLTGKDLPLKLPKACPICGKAVYLVAVTEWGEEDGIVSGIEYECETEPGIDSQRWAGWHRGHFAMPYVDWVPWEWVVLEDLNKTYRWEGR